MNNIMELVIMMHLGTLVGTSKCVDDSDRVELIGGIVVIGRM